MIFEASPRDFNPKVIVAACFIEHGNEVLFLHRSQYVSQPGVWAIPGGKVNEDETPEQAIRREIFEECHLVLKNPVFLHKVYIRYPEYDYEYHMFKEVVTDKPEIKLNLQESDNYAWLTRMQAEELDAENQLILDEMPCIQRVYQNAEFGISVSVGSDLEGTKTIF